MLALYHQHMQGGNSESKHLEYESVDGDFTPEVIERACSNYARLLGIPHEEVTTGLILEKAPSLGIAGWADEYVEIRDNGLIASERRMRERQERSVGGSGDDSQDEVQDQNIQVVRLIAALGAQDNGKKTIIKAMAAKQGIDSEDAEDILEGRSD